MFMRVLVAIIGVLLIVIAMQDGFETVVLPRRVSRRFRLARMFYLTTWMLWSFPARRMHSGNRREYYLSYYGPLSLLLLLIVWANLIVLGFACLQWGLLSPLSSPEKTLQFATYLYMSGTTFVTLGLGDVIPLSGMARFLAVLEAGIGFGFLALIIGYVPIIYQAFSRREANIALLDARAGTPPSVSEILRRHHVGKNPADLLEFLHEWEHWCAELLESQLSYPVLAYYRSQHERQSWLEALTTILDVCALIMVGIDGIPLKPAKFVFAIARHAAVDLAQTFSTPPTLKTNRLPHEDFVRLHALLEEHGIHLSDGEVTEKKLAMLRGMYEPFVLAMAERLVLTLPPWIAPADRVDDWETSAWDHFLESTPRTMDTAMRPE